MTKKKRRTSLLFTFLITAVIWGQDASTTTPLTKLFQEIEANNDCIFAYKDQELKGAIVNFKPSGDLTADLDSLNVKTLFNYNLLPDKTITVALKNNVVTRCVQVQQTVSGQAITNATVSSWYQSKTTNNKGQAQIYTLNKPMDLLVSSAGYELGFFKLNNTQSSTCFKAGLELSTTQLPPITITNYVTKGITKTPDGGINIDYKVFDILPGLIESDVLLTLQALPGIQSVNETVSFLNIRGGTNDQNLILWDGVKMYQNGHFFGLISAFNPNLTTQVDVYKNGSSARYGDGVSGVIAMSGSNQLVDRIHGNAGINLLSADAFLALPIGNKAMIEVAARRSINELWETPTYRAYFDKAFQNTELQASLAQAPNSNEDFSFFDSSLRVLYRPSNKDELRLNLLIMGNELDFLENAQLDGQAVSRNSNLRQDNFAGGLFYSRQWTNNVSSTLQLYGTNYTLMSMNSDIINNQRLLQQNDVLESGLKLATTIELNAQTSLSGGYQLNETGITNFESINNPTFEREEKQVLLTHSGFAELGYSSKNGNTRFVGGLRLNYISKFKDVLLEPRLMVRQRLSKAFTLELNGEIKSQTTTQVVDLQNDFLGVENRRWVLASPDSFPILKGKQLGLGLSYNQNRFLLSLEPYIKEVAGISSQSQGFQNQFENARVHGSYQVYGLDFLANRQWDNTNIWLSYSYAKNDYRFPDLEPQEFPNNIDVRQTITLGASQTVGAFKLAAGINWHRGIPTTGLLTNSPDNIMQLQFDSPNALRIPDYLRIDASATYTMQWSDGVQAVAGVSLWNLFNRETTVNEFYRLNESDEVERLIDRALRFTPNVSFKVNF